MADPIKMWEQTPLGKAVAAHIKNGLWIFPLHGINEDLSCTCGDVPCGKENKNAGKHPYTPTAPNGLLNATDDFEVAAEMFQYRTDLNIGVATGKKSGIIVVDVDNKNEDAGDKSLIKIQELFGILPPTMCLTTGNGYHLVFGYPEGGLKTNSNSYGKEYPGVDIRGDGGYIVIYPSRHYSGRYYEADTSGGAIADLPKLHLDYLRSDKNKKREDVADREQRCGNTSEWTEDQIAEALSFLDPDMAYLDWIFIGMALHKEGFSLDMWDKWSATGRKYQGIGDLNTHWKSFKSSGARTIGTIIDWAMVQGWEPKGNYVERATSAEAERMVAPFLENIKEKKRIEEMPNSEFKMAAMMIGADAVEKIAANVFVATYVPAMPVLVKNADEKVPYVPQFCFNPMDLPGGLGETVRWITKYAIYDQPELAMLNVLAFAGAIFGRRYASPLDTRTNIYLVGIARTGCHAKGTRILMSNGKIKNVEDIKIGEKIMGPNSKPRQVLNLACGQQTMYRVTPTKGEGFSINEDHILSLYHTETKKIKNISVRDYLEKSCKFKHCHKLRRVSVSFPSRKKPLLDPWFLGAMLGDGYFVQCALLTSADKEISNAAIKYAKSLGIPTKIRKLPNGNKASSYRFAHNSTREKNPIRDGLKSLNLWGKTAIGKFIPDEYKLGSRETRMAVLAGLLDTDGYRGNNGYDFISKSEQLSRDVQFVARSLGFAAYVTKTQKYSQLGSGGNYWRVSLSGDMSGLPLVCSRKKSKVRMQKKSCLVTGFSISKLKNNNYYGFQLSGDHLYLTADFIVHHNSGKDHSRKMINKLAMESGLSNYIGGNSIRSDTGMLRGLVNNSAQILQVDEFGIFMQALSDVRAPHHIKAVSRALMSLYSDSNSVYHHGDYADIKAVPIKISAPNLCIYGTTTEDSYIPALKRSALKSGELNRFLVIPSRIVPTPKRNVPLKESDPALVEWWNQFAPNSKSSLGVLANSSTILPKPIIIGWGDCEEIQHQLNLEQVARANEDTPTRDLWSRLMENTIKIAMIFAIARNYEEPEFCQSDFDYAYSIVRASIDYMASLIEECIMETPQEQSHHEVLKAIMAAGEKGISRRELLRMFRRFRKRDIDDLIATMKEEEAVVVGRMIPKVGRPQVVYYAADTEAAKAVNATPTAASAS